MESRRRTRTGRYATALGLGYSQWTIDDLGVILNHYGVPFASRDRKPVLIGFLNQLATERGLTIEDRVAIIEAHRAGSPLPPRRPIVRAPTMPSAQTQPVVDDSAIARPGSIKAVKHECLICYDAFDPVKTLMRQPTSSCVHEVNICKPCLSVSIASQLEAKVWTRIDCPASDCEERLEYGDIQDFAAPQTFARYFEFTFQAAQAGHHFQRCRTPGCNFGQQCFPEDTIMHCHECHHKTCITCDTEMHPGISCGEKAAERETARQIHETQESASTEYLKTQTKVCPGCKAPCQKTGGCDHMTCTRCRHEYCWICFADHRRIWAEGNHRHAPSCRHHSNNLRAAQRRE